MTERRELLSLKPPSKSSFVARSKLRGRQSTLRKLLVWTEYTAGEIQNCATEFRCSQQTPTATTTTPMLKNTVDARKKMCVDFLIN